MSSQGPTPAGGAESGSCAQADTRCRRQLRHSTMPIMATEKSTQPAGEPARPWSNRLSTPHRAISESVRSQIIVEGFYRAGTWDVNR